MKYRIVREETLESFEKAVNEALGRGWHLYEGPWSDGNFWYQTMLHATASPVRNPES
jgi:hypothetical protein